MIKKFTIEIPVGLIWNNDDAKKKCPIACSARMGEWDGKWRTVIEGKMSVCGCIFYVNGKGSCEFTVDVPAGVILSNDDAREKCPIVCASYGGKWNGQWKIVVEGKMSVCGCIFRIM